ncbi:hypothetical protein FA039_18850 [Escherichia coli]|nr:hypothetical protein [Escherichia coli]
MLDDAVALTPATAIRGVLHGINPERLTIELSDADGNIILSYQEHQPQELPLPDVAKAPLAAQDITSTDEARFIGQHLEQYHHASRSPFDYYLRGVALDPLDYRCNRRWRCWNITEQISASGGVCHSGAETRTCAKQNPQCGQASLIRASAYERQGNINKPKRISGGRSGAATVKQVAIMVWHGWRRVMVTSTLVWIFANKVFAPAQPIRKCFACIICCWC